MKREVYIWVLIIIAIAAVAIYFRYFYQPVISVELGIRSGTNTTLYPYQRAMFDINVFNNGSAAITNMSLGVLVNNNLTTLYKITLPAGKQTTIAFNYSPTVSGAFNISVVADPGKLYALSDRSHARASSSINVIAAQNATPSALLPTQNISSSTQSTMTSGAYLLGSYMLDQFNISRFTLTHNRQVDTFLKPLLNLTSYYIKNVSVATASYQDNSSVYSVWIKGYVAPSIFSAATLGTSLSTTTVNTTDGNATFIKMLNDTTFCGWYSGGWLKILAEQRNVNCYEIINASTATPSGVRTSGLETAFAGSLVADNSTLLANYSSSGPNGAFLARLSLVGNASFVYGTVSNISEVKNTTCFGIISSVNGSSYCSTYVFPKSGQLGSIALIETKAYKGDYNLSAFALVNSSLALEQAQSNVDLLQQVNVSGASLAFSSGIVNSCEFNDSFGCSGIEYNNGTASFKVKNNLNSTALLNSVHCYVTSGIFSTPLNITLSPGASVNVTTDCYQFTSKLSGATLNLHLSLAMNYTASNSTRIVVGSAFIPFG